MSEKNKYMPLFTQKLFSLFVAFFFAFKFLNELRSYFRMATGTAKYFKLILFHLLLLPIFIYIQFKEPQGQFHKSMGFIDLKLFNL